MNKTNLFIEDVLNKDLNCFKNDENLNINVIKNINEYIKNTFLMSLENLEKSDGFKLLSTKNKKQMIVSIFNSFEKLKKYWNIEIYDTYLHIPELETSEMMELSNFNIYIEFKYNENIRNFDYKYIIPRCSIIFNDFTKTFSFIEKNSYLYPAGYDYEGDFIPIVYDVYIANKLLKTNSITNKIKAWFIIKKVKLQILFDNRLSYCLQFNLPLHKL